MITTVLDGNYIFDRYTLAKKENMQLVEFFQKLFDSSDFPARWHCGQWTPFLGWLYIISDLLIWGAYFAIPAIIVRYAIKRRESISYHPVLFLFAIFILACGSTHFIDAIIFYHPVYRFSALLRVITAVVSWATVYYMIRFLPSAFSLKTPKELEYEIERRKEVEADLMQINERLMEAQKIARIAYASWRVGQEDVWMSDAGYDVFGLPRSLRLDREWVLQRLHPEEKRNFIRNIELLRKGKSSREFYSRFLTFDGKVRYVLVKATSEKNAQGRVVVIKGTVQDITRERRSLEQIEHQNAVLKEIAWIQSHDVRGPVATILGLANLYEDEAFDETEQQEFVRGMKIAALDLDKIIHRIVKKTDSIDMGTRREEADASNEALSLTEAGKS